MRVGFLTPSLSKTSGWGRYTFDLIAALGAQGVDPVILSSATGPATLDLPHAGYYPILPAPRSKRRWVTPRTLARLPTVRRLLRDCDMVHCSAEPFVPVAALSGKPWVTSAYGTYLPRALNRRVMGKVFAWAIMRAAAVICISKYTEAQVKALLPGAPTTVILPGVHWEHFAGAPTEPPEIDARPVIVAVGQVKPRKGFHIVAEAMQTVRETHPGAQYVIIGDTSSAPDFATGLGAMPGVRVLGRVSDADLRAWYHHADLLAQTPVNAAGKFEGFGLIYLEAGAAGIPSVGAYGSGAEEAIIHEETGLLVPQNNPTATAGALLRLLGDDALRSRLAAGAYWHARTNGWDRVAAQVKEVYQSVL